MLFLTLISLFFIPLESPKLIQLHSMINITSIDTVKVILVGLPWEPAGSVTYNYTIYIYILEEQPYKE
jgi:hypothetical protein